MLQVSNKHLIALLLKLRDFVKVVNKLCFLSYDGNTFTELPGKTKYDHRNTRLLSYRNTPLAVGDRTNNKVEILEFGIWDELEVYPYHN